ncbi:flagellar basal-body protein FlbY [Asticcacaulis sp. ZE23SCel15]|uniref:flagellar basal-body protein FlbY n=1 Tax=Asticcacaulis sp. ZE23SCel15 TaxID=3059027 RepID=UPI00265FB2B6|nr:flagellar basal-body protein FlbY [Asticcacaulis sp. ZE23SCel15]WKL56848.1 flagellar basal-body protein FlbY [Asticcacaulis sp. ZE23SCel15]
MTLSANNASDRARQIFSLTERLGERLAFETRALEAHRPQDIHAGIEETRQLSNLYRMETARLKADPTLLSGLNDTTKSQLRTATESFMEIAKRHSIAVEAARTVTEGILHTIATDISERKSQGASYGPGARQVYKAPTSLNMTHRA